ncbi:hypothetical protein [Paenibacillus tengchongensis]|uniref:hypothetical protein n=1 Tax=Paenibacillus tengchongensis TaxID=2608684 RepID=UPI00124D5560|nr:hypothetical protein [Paenibacillus tengchongensis]
MKKPLPALLACFIICMGILFGTSNSITIEKAQLLQLEKEHIVVKNLSAKTTKVYTNSDLTDQLIENNYYFIRYKSNLFQRTHLTDITPMDE